MTPKRTLKLKIRHDGIAHLNYEPKSIDFDKPMTEWTTADKSYRVVMEILYGAIQRYNQEIIGEREANLPM